MPKQGIFHDYDLKANEESSAQNQTCAVCGTSPMTFQWSDYSGEGMCTKCGCPYQLKWGSTKMQEEGNYPYLNMNDEFLPIAKEYWEETKWFVCYGMKFGSRPSMSELNKWIESNHPELIKDEKKES